MKYKVSLIIFLTITIFLSLQLNAQYWTADSDVRNGIRKVKLTDQLPDIMKEYGIPVWVIINRDPNDDPDNIFWPHLRHKRLDPVSELIGAENTFYPSIFIFTQTGEKIALIENKDVNFIKQTGIYTKIRSYPYARQTYMNPVLQFFKEEIQRLNPEKIGINISESEPVADGITVGLKRMLEKTLGENYSGKFVSAEDIIITLWGIKTEEELKYIKRSGEIAHNLMIKAFENVEVSTTSVTDFFNFIRTEMKVNGWRVGWDEVMCPIVRFWPSEDVPKNKIIAQRGSLIGVNAGVLTKGYSNDLDRTAYILREKETAIPKDIQFMWSTLRNAVEAVVTAMKPGAVGIEVDKIARKIISDAGFELYWYQTGHPVGVWVHDIGTYIGPNHPHYGRKVFLKLHEGEVYAIEPGVSKFSEELNATVRLHLQEMVVVTNDGGKYLVPPQKEIFLIK